MFRQLVLRTQIEQALQTTLIELDAVVAKPVAPECALQRAVAGPARRR